MDANGARVTTWLDHGNIYEYPDRFVQSTKHHPMDLVADIANERRWARKRIGVEMDAYYFTGACIDRLRKKLPRARFKDATSLVNWCASSSPAASFSTSRRPPASPRR